MKMRKYLRNQILEILPTILEGVEYANNSTSNNALTVLNDCIDGIKAISDTLKNNLSEQRFKVYDELLNGLEESLKAVIESISNSSVFLLTERIKKLLSRFEIELINEPEIKIEILFLPYKASMWDSLESIWLAAKDDPQCECFVMPIPYYDRKPDGSFGELHYEGDQFPEYVPITHYENYNISFCKPDIIYIHNPYDGYNYVTSVDPRYYSDRLKQYTDMLVYVPYFFVGGKMPDSHLDLPAYKYVDKIIVQSDKVKEQMKKYLPESKIVALGSPKADRMIYLDEHKPKIPKYWTDIIKDKKVVMFNTSISGLLQYNEKTLEKINYVFDCFKNRNDVVLLWRPHPLIKSTLKSMRPELLPKYEALENKFVNEKIGILDTTPDINASVAISDAYVGEASSSVVSLFGVTGKPIFITQMMINEVPAKEDRLSVHFWSCYREDNDIWFVSSPYNSLCKMDVNTGKVDIIKTIDNNLLGELQYRDVVKINNEIILQPSNAQSIVSYNMKNDKIKRIEFNSAMSWGNFSGMIKYNNDLFMKPSRYPTILQYNIESGTCWYHYEPILELIQYVNNYGFIFGRGAYVNNNIMLMPLINTNKVLEFNMDNYNYKLHEVGSKGCNYNGIEFDGKDYWLIPYESSYIVKWNYETGEYTEYNNYPAGFKTDANKYMRQYCYFTQIVNCGKFMLAFPLHANMIVKIDIATGEMSEFKLDVAYNEGERKNCYYSEQSNYYFAQKFDDNTVIALTSYDNTLLFIDIHTGKTRKMPVRIDEEDLKSLSESMRCIQEEYNDDYIAYRFVENLNYTLDEFLNDLVNGNCIGHTKANQKKAYSMIIKNLDGACGKKTHEYMKEIVKL